MENKVTFNNFDFGWVGVVYKGLDLEVEFQHFTSDDSIEILDVILMQNGEELASLTSPSDWFEKGLKDFIMEVTEEDRHNAIKEDEADSQAWEDTKESLNDPRRFI